MGSFQQIPIWTVIAMFLPFLCKTARAKDLSRDGEKVSLLQQGETEISTDPGQGLQGKSRKGETPTGKRRVRSIGVGVGGQGDRNDRCEGRRPIHWSCQPGEVDSTRSYEQTRLCSHNNCFTQKQ